MCMVYLSRVRFWAAGGAIVTTAFLPPISGRSLTSMRVISPTPQFRKAGASFLLRNRTTADLIYDPINFALGLTVNRRPTRTPPRLGSKWLYQLRNCRFSDDLIAVQS
jgi:hypothetical protein